MSDKKYIVKNLAPWMLDELIAFSQITSFDIIFLRRQNEFYKKDIEQLAANGVNIFVRPHRMGNIAKKMRIILKFIINNIRSFKPDYNFIIGFKSIIWFLKLDLSKFSSNSNIHAQFATQPALVSLLIKKYFNNKPLYSFTFHAYDIYFRNRWFKVLTKNCKKAFSISEFNIKYIEENYITSNKVILGRLGVFRNKINRKEKEQKTYLTLGLMSWFIEKKGIIYLLKTFKHLKENGFENIKLKLAGDGPLKKDFLDYIEENDLGNMIENVGKIKSDEKEKFYKSLDIFVLPAVKLKNDQDGIPVVLMEAIAYGLPLISTNVSGIPEICLDQYNGRLIKERDTRELYDSIIELYENKEKRLEYSNNAYSLSSEYDIVANSKTKLINLEWI